MQIMKNFFVYILKCADRSYYVGHTDDIEKRLAEHSRGIASRYTSMRLPVELVFIQACSSRNDAFIAERKLKQWSRKKKEALMNSDWKKVALLARKKFLK